MAARVWGAAIGREGNGGGASRPWSAREVREVLRASPARSLRVRGVVSQHWSARGWERVPPNKAMKLTRRGGRRSEAW